jgi:hypothetical protein
LKRNGPDAAFPKVLRHFDHHVDRHGRREAIAGDVYRGIDDWDLVFGELNVDGRSSDLNYSAFYGSV